AYAPKKKFLTEFPAPEFAWRRILCGLCRAADAALCFACEFAWRQILVCFGGVGCVVYAWRQNSFLCLFGRWRGLGGVKGCQMCGGVRLAALGGGWWAARRSVKQWCSLCVYRY
ncbi:hypothetical protein, partial [Streptomyces sp. NPDC057718]|uniref:hypothetical protein n=1 Tax=Streptomyces sp. NPDC057718 TaxID=3346225 RepID=UPI003686473E